MLTCNADRIMWEAIAGALEPPPTIDLLAFAEEHITFEEGPFPGPYSRHLFPFADEILRALSPDDCCRFVTLMTSAQCSKPTIAQIFCLGSISMGRGSFLYAHPTESNAIRFSKMKLSPMMRSTRIVSELFPTRTNDAQASVLYRERRDGLSRLLISGANSPSSLSQITIDAACYDDLAKWELNSAGDPETQAESRSRAVSSAKIFKISTPLLDPGCRITKAFNAGSQEHGFVPCWACGEYQTLEWENMLAGLDEDRPEDAHFTCVSCGSIIEEHHRPEMLTRFEWRARNPAARKEHRSFALWSAYSPLQSWGQVAREWLKARGDADSERVFYNDTVGRAWQVKGVGRPWEELAARGAASSYRRGTVPKGALLIFLGIDCQIDRVEWALWGFGRNYCRFAIDYGVIERNICEPDAQRNLDLLLQRQWPDFQGRPRSVMAAAIDANYETDAVLEWARKWPAHRLICVRGISNDVAPRISKVQRERDEKKGQVRKAGGRFYNLNVSNFKMSLYRDLEKTDAELPGFVSFPRGMEDRFFQELVSETRTAIKRMGFTIYRWLLPDRASNEMLDCACYATACALKSGVNGLSDLGWQRLEGMHEGTVAPVAEPPRPSMPAHMYQPPPASGPASAPANRPADSSRPAPVNEPEPAAEWITTKGGGSWI